MVQTFNFGTQETETGELDASVVYVPGQHGYTLGLSTQRGKYAFLVESFFVFAYSLTEKCQCYSWFIII